MSHAVARTAPQGERGTIVAFPFGAEELTGLRAELGASTQVHACDSPAELIATIARVSPELVLVAVRDRTAASTAPVMSRVCREFPGTPVVAYGALTYADLHGTLAAGRAGVRRLAVRGYDSLRTVLGDVRRDAEHRQVVDKVMEALQPFDSDLLRWMVRHCVTRGRDHPTVESVARARRVSVGTLTNYLHRDGYATPGRVVVWSRVLAAAAGLEVPGRSVGRVAADLGFSNASELRMMIKRHTGLRTSELRARGGLAHAAALFHAQLSSHGDAEEDAPAPRTPAPRTPAPRAPVP